LFDVVVSIEVEFTGERKIRRYFFENPMAFKKRTTAAVEKNLRMYPRIITRSKKDVGDLLP